MPSNVKSSKSNNNESLRLQLVDFMKDKIIKKQMKYLNKIYNDEIVVFEIYNYEVLISIFENIIKYIDNPSRYIRKEIKYLVGQFNYSEELIILSRLLPIFRFHLRDRKLSKILLPLTRILEETEFRKTKDNSYEEDDLIKETVEFVDNCIALEIEDEEENDLIFDNTIKTLQSIDKKNNTERNFGLDLPDFTRDVEEMKIFPNILIPMCTGMVNIISTNRFTSFE